MTDWKHELGQEYLALLEGGELGREAYRAGQIAKAEELGRMDARATQGTASLYEQVQHALFGARFWVSRARIKKAMHPIELMSTMLEHHHGGDSERAVSGWHQAIRAAASAGQIIPRDAVSLMPLPVLPVGDDWLLTLPDADKFLEPLGWAVSDYLVHVFDDCFPTAAPAQTATPAPVEDVGATGEPTGPLPLTTGDIAFCFDGLHWDEDGWKKPLGDKPKWLKACIVIPGQRGVSATRWNPVLIGAELVKREYAKLNSVRSKFQTKPLLTPWREEWKTYEADNFDKE